MKVIRENIHDTGLLKQTRRDESRGDRRERERNRKEIPLSISLFSPLILFLWSRHQTGEKRRERREEGESEGTYYIEEDDA